MRNFFIASLIFLSVACFAAPSETSNNLAKCVPVNPWPPSDPKFNINTFCDQFEEAAYCHCAQSLPYVYCKNVIKMSGIYQRMLERFHDIATACKIGQEDIPADMCVLQWNYYKAASCRKIP